MEPERVDILLLYNSLDLSQNDRSNFYNINMSFLDFTGSAISNILDFSLKAGKPVFREMLRSRLWKSVIRSFIKLVMIFIAVLLVIFLPFGEWGSEIFASVVFIGVFVWSLVNGILIVKNNYKLPIFIIQEMSFVDGIIEFVNERWYLAGAGIKLYDSLRAGKGRFSGHFNKLPSSQDVVKDYLLYKYVVSFQKAEFQKLDPIILVCYSKRKEMPNS